MIPYDALFARARATLPPDVFAYYAAGSGDGQTLGEAEAAWREYALRPRTLRGVSSATAATTLLGQDVASPVVVAPTAAHAFATADGEIATATAAAETGVLYVVSTRATARLDDVAAVAGQWWMQIYVMTDRGLSDELARRAAAAGAGAMVVTVDTPTVAAKRDEPSGLRFPEPRLLPELDDAPAESLAQAADVTSADLERIGEITGLPVVAKGVLRADEARTCVDAGAAAVVVSTHGGRQLDGVVPTARALPEVAAAVGDDAEVYVDGGIRHGRDVLRALALGARSAWIGRPVLWALADGVEGVVDLLSALRADVAETLLLAGCRSPRDTGPDLVWQPTWPRHTVEG